jgi:phage baseplate assembly protein W
MANLVINLSTISKSAAGNVYKDIKVPLSRSFDANFDALAVKQSIQNIFSWRRGQRILDPLFGNVIYEFVYEPINDITIKNLRAAIIKMLAYEPRIEIISLDITSDNDQNTINVSLKYLIPKLNVMDSYSVIVNVISF